MEPSLGHLDIRTLNGATVVSFLDRKILDELNITRMEEELFSLADRNPQVKMVLDFSNVEHLSSRALGTLISLMKRVRTGGGELALCSIADRIFDVFKITRLDTAFDIHRTPEAAVLRLTGGEAKS